MIPLAGDSPASLAAILGARARTTPPSRLGLDIAGGAAIAAVTLWARPSGWGAVLSAAVCFLAYGIWAVAERRLPPDPLRLPTAADRALRSAQTVAAIVGLTAFVVLLFALLGVVLGPIVS
jgi:hypothetical protein